MAGLGAGSAATAAALKLLSKLTKLGKLAQFTNKLPARLADELALAEKLKVKPLTVGDAGFAKIANQGTMKWAVTESGELVFVPKMVKQHEIPHSVLSGGKPVLAAGEAEVFVANGKVYATINNHTGHYQTSAESLVVVGSQAFELNGIKVLEAKEYVP